MKICHFKNLKKWFDQTAPINLSERERKGLFKLLSKKLAYPHDYMNSLEKYNETELPLKVNFHNLLNDEHVIIKRNIIMLNKFGSILIGPLKI